MARCNWVKCPFFLAQVLLFTSVTNLYLSVNKLETLLTSGTSGYLQSLLYSVDLGYKESRSFLLKALSNGVIFVDPYFDCDSKYFQNLSDITLWAIQLPRREQELIFGISCIQEKLSVDFNIKFIALTCGLPSALSDNEGRNIKYCKYWQLILQNKHNLASFERWCYQIPKKCLTEPFLKQLDLPWILSEPCLSWDYNNGETLLSSLLGQIEWASQESLSHLLFNLLNGNIDTAIKEKLAKRLRNPKTLFERFNLQVSNDNLEDKFLRNNLGEVLRMPNISIETKLLILRTAVRFCQYKFYHLISPFKNMPSLKDSSRLNQEFFLIELMTYVKPHRQIIEIMEKFGLSFEQLHRDNLSIMELFKDRLHEYPLGVRLKLHGFFSIKLADSQRAVWRPLIYPFPSYTSASEVRALLMGMSKKSNGFIIDDENEQFPSIYPLLWQPLRDLQMVVGTLMFSIFRFGFSVATLSEDFCRAVETEQDPNIFARDYKVYVERFKPNSKTMGLPCPFTPYERRKIRDIFTFREVSNVRSQRQKAYINTLAYLDWNLNELFPNETICDLLTKRFNNYFALY